DGFSSLRRRRRNAICASAVASRACASWSTRRTSGSPANTLSLALTSTSPMTPIVGAPILISPEAGSTRPGATACQRLSSAASARTAFEASSAHERGANTATTTVPPASQHASNQMILRVCIVVDPDTVLVCGRRPCRRLFLPDDAAVLDPYHAIGERQDAGIVLHHQHAMRRILGDLGEQRHDGVAILAVQRSGRLVRPHRRWSA